MMPSCGRQASSDAAAKAARSREKESASRKAALERQVLLISVLSEEAAACRRFSVFEPLAYDNIIYCTIGISCYINCLNLARLS